MQKKENKKVKTTLGKLKKKKINILIKFAHFSRTSVRLKRYLEDIFKIEQLLVQNNHYKQSIQNIFIIKIVNLKVI